MLKISDIVNKVIIKRSIMASIEDDLIYDRQENPYDNYQAYRDAYYKVDSFLGYRFYASDFEGLVEDAREVNRMVKDNSLIPYYLDDDTIRTLIERKRSSVLNSYEERNNYYRRYLGLPDIYYDEKMGYIENPSQIAYMTERINGIDIRKPIHRYNNIEKRLFKASGNLKKLIEARPDLPYLRYLDKDIDIINLRDGKPYDVVWYDKNDDEIVAFVDIYRSVRNKFITAHNNQYDDITYEIHESLMCCNLMLTALANYNANMPMENLNSIYNDKSQIYALFSTFGLPKFDFSMKILSEIASKINTLTMKKGTKDGLHEISKIFDEITIFKYYIVKRVKEVIDLDTVTDPKEKYELFFAKAPVDVDDPYPYIQTKSELLPFRETVDRDARWGYADNKLEDEIKSMDFSYSESKYLGLNNKIDIFSFSLEMAYFYRFIVEHKDIVERLKIYIDTVDVNGDLFEILTYLQLLVYKKYKVSPDIPDTLSSIMYMYSIKKNIDYERIKLLFKDYFKYHKPEERYNIDELNSLLTGVNSVGEVMDTFEVNYKLVKWLYELRATTRKYRDFVMIDDTIRAITYGEKIPEIYNGHDNLETFMSTYNSESSKYIVRLAELGASSNPVEAINEEITIVINLLKSKINMIKHKSLSNMFEIAQNVFSDMDLINYLERIVDFYKSYTQDIIDRGVTYAADDITDNLHILEELTFYLNFNYYELFTLSLIFTSDSNELVSFVKKLIQKVDYYEQTEILSIIKGDNYKVEQEIIGYSGFKNTF